ncbi:RHS repeat-associated core domain-containing protein [Xanthomonas campestris]
MLIGIELPDGGEIIYAYDDRGNLTSAQRPDGSIRSYLYDEPDLVPNGGGSLITGIADDTVRYATFRYDTSSRPILSALHSQGGLVEKVTLNYIGESAAQVVDINDSTHIYEWSTGPFKDITSDVVAGAGYQRTYDINGRVSHAVDGKGKITQYSYEDHADGSQAVEIESAGQLKTEERDRNNNILKKIVRSDSNSELGLLEKYVYDADDRLNFHCSYENLKGDYICGSQLTAPVGVRQWQYARCDGTETACPVTGLLLYIQGPGIQRAGTTRFSYYTSDELGCQNNFGACLYRKGDLQKVTNALGRVTEYLAYDGAGRPLSIKDTNGIVTDYTYHPRGWLTASKVRGSDASSEADDRITRIDYWPTGLVKQVTQPDGALTAFTYDAAHRLTDITDNAGNTVHYTLDNAGNRVKEDTQDAAGTLKRTLSRVYNQLGQLKTQATAASDPTDFEYDANGNATKVTDALATATQSEYDPLNRLSRTLQDVAGIKANTTFDYDALDNLTKVTDPKGLDTKYEYNGFGDLVKLTSPDTGVTSYTYDSAGNRATQTDARGNTAAYGYDALNRLTKVGYPTSGLNVAYTYDVTQTACASGETFSIGRLTKMQDGGAITQYCYNRFGDLVRKVQTSNGKALVLRYDYTVGGQLRRMTYPDGAVVDYVRNAQGQTTEVGVTPAGGSRQVLLGNASYYPFGPAAGWTYGNGRTLARRYDLDYRPQAIQDTRPGGLEVGFGFDPAGNLTALTPAGNPTPEIGLGYDTLGRLTGLKDGRTGTLIDGYSYDATGNRLSAKVGTATQAYTYPTDSHRLSSMAGVARSYDATGNTTAIGGTARQYTYDTTGRMTQARRAGAVTMNYRYNGRGEQVRRFLGTTNTYTLYDEAGHWLGDYDNNGAPKQQAIWLDDLPVGLLANANTLHYIEPDHLGSPRVVIDPTSDVAVWTWSLKGEAFGNTAPNQDPDGDGAALVLDMRFPGQRFDAASGLSQNYFRDYDPATGRYGQSDPIGLEGGINTYGYVAGQPLSLMDPTGQNPVAAGACLIPGIGWGGCALVGATMAVGTCYVTGACQRAAQSAGDWLDEQLGALSESGLAAGPAPYDHYQENAALYFTPDPFGGDEACRKLAHAIRVLRAQISWRRTDLNPRSASYKGHSTRIAILSAALAKLESSYRNICGSNCPG